MDQWIGLRESLNRKPREFSQQIRGFPVSIFPVATEVATGLGVASDCAQGAEGDDLQALNSAAEHGENRILTIEQIEYNWFNDVLVD